MPANAASLRRILQSIGSHAIPSTNTLRAIPSTRTSHAEKHLRHSSTASAVLRTRPDDETPNTDTSTGDGPHVPTRKTPSSGSMLRDIESTPREITNKATTDAQEKDEVQSIVKEGFTFSKQYFHAHKSDDKHRMKQRARRSLLSKKRSEISEKQAWREILYILEKHSPSAAEHIKRMDTIRLPEGIFAQWIRDPGESILEVMQRTGSHVQVKPTKEMGLFSSITLRGTPSQNAAAKKLLQESDLLSAVSEDDLNASKSLADYHLRSEIGKPVDRTNRSGNGPQTSDDQLYDKLEDELDEFDLSDLEDAVAATTTRDQARAVWSKPGTMVLGESFKIKGPKGHMVIGTTKSAVPSTTIAFTARIEQITADRPRRLWSMDSQASGVPGIPIEDELVALMTKSDNAHLITPAAACLALRYLTKHMFFPAIREVLNALKDANRQHGTELLNADLFNALLDAAARHENVVAFHYIVNTMRERSISPNAGTWIAFHTLMLKRYPADSDKVLAKMKEKAVQTEPSVAIENLEAHSSQLLMSFMKERPKASIKDFVKNMNRDVADVKWLTTFSANVMCNTLLKRGQIQHAFEIVDELIRNGGRPDVVTLNTFLTAAKKDGHLPLAIEILRKFQDLHAKSIALASTAGNSTTVLPRVQDLSITPNGDTFSLLFTLAWNRKYMNCTRVFWRYACCAGHVAPQTTKLMTTSAGLQSAAEGFIQTEDISTRGPMWKAWAAKFAMGVKAGLGPVQAAEVIRIVSHPAVNNAPSESTPSASSPEHLALSQAQARNKATRDRRALIITDQNEVRSLKPVRSLAELASEALQMDKSWKERNLGLPKGMLTYGNGDTMFEMMLKEGVEVPVEVGSGVGLKL